MGQESILQSISGAIILMKIGYDSASYIHRRNIVGKIPHVDYVKVINPNRVLTGLANAGRKLIRGMPVVAGNMRFRFRDFDLNRVDLLHFFNTISFGTTPWITTFETLVPRYSSTFGCHQGESPDFLPLTGDKKIRRALQALRTASCRKLIALSRLGIHGVIGVVCAVGYLPWVCPCRSEDEVTESRQHRFYRNILIISSAARVRWVAIGRGQ